jgi:hypothetical protein
MANCAYCGRPAGFFRRWHKRCHEAAEETCKRLTADVVTYVAHGDGPVPGPSAIVPVKAVAKVPVLRLRKAVLTGFEKAVESMLQDHVCSEEEEARLHDVTSTWQLERLELDAHGSHTKLVKAGIIRDLLNGRVPSRCQVQNSNLLLQKNESFIWVFQPVTFYQVKTRREYKGASGGLSIRVAKGVYFRTSRFRGHPVDTSSNEKMGDGDFIVTNKNLFFITPERTTKVSVRKLVSVNRLTDGIELECAGTRGKRYAIANLDSWFAFNVLSNLSALD